MYPRSELFITSDNPEAGTPASRNAPRSVDELRRIIGKTLDEAARNRQIGHPPRSESGAGRAETPEAPRRPQPHIDTAPGSWRRSQPGGWLVLGGLILAPLLIVWNAVTAVTLLYQGNFAARAAEPQLNSMGAAIREVLAEHQREMEASHGNRQATSTAFSAGMDRLCGESLHAAPARASEINLAGDASSRACLMRSALSANMAVRERMAVEAAVEGYLYKSLWYLESIRVPVGERDGSKRMLDAVAGIIAGLLCLALLRRHAHQPQTAGNGGTPEASGPARELDDPGLFFFCDVFDRTPVALVLLDRDGRITRLNQAAERFTGYATADVMRSFYGDVFLDRADGGQEAVKFPLSSDAGPVVKETWVSRTGERRTTLWSHALFHDESQELTHVLLAVSPGSREHQASGY